MPKSEDGLHIIPDKSRETSSTGTVGTDWINTKHSSTQIDNIYVNTYKFDFSVYPVINDLSDHDVQIIAFTDISTSTPRQSFTMIRKVKRNTITNLAYVLSYENWEDVFFRNGS